MHCRVLFQIVGIFFVCFAAQLRAAEFIGTVVDASTELPIAARVYVQGNDGSWLFVQSDSPDGSALEYREQWVPMPGSIEQHTTISAHPFRIELKAGDYVITIERGKEYFPLIRKITVSDEPLQETFHLKRWVDLASRGWFSGETHVHRRISELGNVQIAEDLNVTFPVTFWTTEAFARPNLDPSSLRRQGPSPFGPREDRGHVMIEVDATHVMFPRNTEYEIFSIAGKRHVLGAVFLLNHHTAFTQGMPPVREIAERAHREGALLDLDKHSWPWSMMLVPIAGIDLYELSNNSVWRTAFGFRRTSTVPAEYMKVESDAGGMTEWGWLNFGFENYYVLLNCGFRIQPTAGTASGVHPVPLGYSRVYVHLDRPFSGAAWIDGLRRGNSFVTTGPMIFARVDGTLPGTVFKHDDDSARNISISGETVSEVPLDRIEVVVNGRVIETIAPGNVKTSLGAYATRFRKEASIERTSWVALRCVERRPSGRVRFAHTAPWHIEIAGQSPRPRRVEIDYLIQRIEDEIRRNQDMLPEEAMAEFRSALEIYQRIAERAVE